MIRSMLLGSRDTTEAAKRHARVAVSPEITHIGLTGFKHLDEARELGRQAAEEALAAEPDFVASARSES
jgi:predicted acylesterase/phospholipase RssA